MIKPYKENIQSCANTDFQIFTKKVGALQRLPEYPNSDGYHSSDSTQEQKSLHNFATVCITL